MVVTIIMEGTTEESMAINTDHFRGQERRVEPEHGPQSSRTPNK